MAKERHKDKSHDTFNDLDPEFQLQPGDDPEKIFPAEFEMIKELRKDFPDFKEYSDKYLVIFLCSRRHDIEETKKVMKNYMENRKRLGLGLRKIKLEVSKSNSLTDSFCRISSGCSE